MQYDTEEDAERALREAEGGRVLDLVIKVRLVRNQALRLADPVVQLEVLDAVDRLPKVEGPRLVPLVLKRDQPVVDEDLLLDGV